ncbi:MAG: hypothetical protein HKN28_08625, partial [Alphaproteobacteria bacterium]|nr:hypothetical protein [Alphaproteobacteria bacterium]
MAVATHVGAPSQYADSVIDQGTVGSILVAPHSSSDNVLGAEDGTGGTGWFNLGSGFGDDGDDPEGFIIVSFEDNAVIPDGTAAPDLTVWEASSNGNNNDLSDVFVSADGINWFLVGEARDHPAPVPGGNPPFANEFDIDGTGLTFVKFVKLVNKMAPNNDGASGFDADAFEGITSIGTDDIVKINTGLTGIDVGSGVLQTGFEFEITITNNTGVAGGLSELTFFDAVPAEFD